MLQLDRYLLRPLRREDGEALLAWRNSDYVRPNMFTTHRIGVEEHRNWLASTLHDEHSHYLIFEDGTRPLGLVSFPRIDPEARSCHWGFYMGEKQTVSSGLGTLMCYLALSKAFSDFDLELVHGETWTFNVPAQRIHEKLGFSHDHIETRQQDNGQKGELVCFSLSRSDWERNKASLDEQIMRYVKR